MNLNARAHALILDLHQRPGDENLIVAALQEVVEAACQSACSYCQNMPVWKQPVFDQKWNLWIHPSHGDVVCHGNNIRNMFVEKANKEQEK